MPADRLCLMMVPSRHACSHARARSDAPGIRRGAARSDTAFTFKTRTFRVALLKVTRIPGSAAPSEDLLGWVVKSTAVALVFCDVDLWVAAIRM
jgi:hypothetical protein